MSAVVTLACVFACPGSAAASLKPSIAGFAASEPMVTSAGGGYEKLSATVRNGATCELSSKPAVPGLPAFFRCGSEEVSDRVLLPLNATRKTEKYKFALDVTGGGKTVKSAAKVTVLKSAGSEVLLGATQLAANGNGGACARLSTGHVTCWGANYYGGLGDGRYGESSTPEPVSVLSVGGSGTLAGVKSVVGDELEGYCALLETGQVACWGYNYQGEAGAGSAGAREACSPTVCATPVLVAGNEETGHLEGVKRLFSLPGSGFCAILSSGGLDCWGDNKSGQLGDGLTANSNAPVPVALPSVPGQARAVQLAATQDATCVLTQAITEPTSSAVYCWGNNESGQLGNGTFLNSDSPQVALEASGDGPLTNATSIESGSQEASFCALLGSAQADCWGFGFQLGAGQAPGHLECYPESFCSSRPLPVLGLGGAGTLTGVTAVAYSASAYCAIVAKGRIACWGEGSSGALGDGHEGTPVSYVPVQVVGVGSEGDLEAADTIATSLGSTCALLAAGGVDCWGWDDGGQLGNGIVGYDSGNGTSPTPEPVLSYGARGALGGVTSLVPTEVGYCTILALGAVDCWGSLEGGLVPTPSPIS
jgi:hypothetical protein